MGLSHQAILQLSRHHLGILHFDSILEELTRNKHQAPRLRAQSCKYALSPQLQFQSKVWVAAFVSDRPALNRKCHAPLLRFDDLLKLLSKLKKSSLLTRLSVYYKWTQLGTEK